MKRRRRRSTRRKPWIAGLLSLLEPGLGQIYNGQIRKGLLFLALPLLAIPADILFVTSDSLVFLLVVFALVQLTYYIIVTADAIVTANRPRVEKYKLKKYNHPLVYLSIFVAVSIVDLTISSYMQSNYVQFMGIDNPGNEPTLLVGDHILVDRRSSARNPKRGELIVLEYPQDSDDELVKRMVAMGGDLVEIQDKTLLINNHPVEEHYVSYGESIIVDDEKQALFDNFEAMTIPENSYFVLGDNRSNSYDSRSFGILGKEAIKGTVKAIYWSWDNVDTVVRRERIGLKIQ